MTELPTRAGLSWPAKIGLSALALGIVLMSALLWPEWRHNPDLSHGLFMPVIFLLLLHEARSAGPFHYLGGRIAIAVTTILISLGLITLITAGLYAAAVDWSHPLVEFLLACVLGLFLGAALAAFADERLRLMPFNWSAAVAASLWPLSAPIPPGTYTRLTLELQLALSSAVLRTLQILDIAAHRQGNLIELARGVVGVEEACSGVRSLISCIFVGIFFSACIVRRPGARALIIASSIPLALGMNFIRSLTLTLLANAGVNIEGAWHDLTGYAVLALTAAALFGLSLALERRRPSAFANASADKSARQADLPYGKSPPALRVLIAALALSAALLLVFRLETGSSVSMAPTPDLLAILPAQADGWNVETRSDLSLFQSTLRTDLLAERGYLHGDRATGIQIDLYLAYWRPGQAPASFVATHTPDACWPGTGWNAQPISPSHAALPFLGSWLPPAESRLFTNSGFPRYVWFWQVYDNKPVPFESPYSARDLLHLAWHYGFRHDASQLFVRVTSNRPWNEIAGDPLLRRFFQNLRPFGF
jgi:exosortase